MNEWHSMLLNTVGLVSCAIGLGQWLGPIALVVYGAAVLAIDMILETGLLRRKEAVED